MNKILQAISVLSFAGALIGIYIILIVLILRGDYIMIIPALLITAVLAILTRDCQ